MLQTLLIFAFMSLTRLEDLDVSQETLQDLEYVDEEFLHQPENYFEEGVDPREISIPPEFRRMSYADAIPIQPPIQFLLNIFKKERSDKMFQVEVDTNGQTHSSCIERIFCKFLPPLTVRPFLQNRTASPQFM